MNGRVIHGQFGPIVPRVLSWLGGGRMWPVEGLDVPRHRCFCGVPEHHDAIATCHIIDAGGHIDYLHETPDRLLRGLAVRVQEWRPQWDGAWPWNTFTLRTRGRRGVDLELEHLIRTLTAPDEGLLRPAYHIQTYMRGDQVDSIGMVRTVDLVRYMQATPIGQRRVSAQPVGTGHNNFKAAGWDELVAAGIPVRIWQRQEVAA